MAVLERQQTRRAVSLSSRHIVGRSRACQLQLDAPTISGAHALIEWSETAEWSIRDLGSKNGTFVDGKRLASDASTRLSLGARIAFGGESEVWKMVDARPPEPIARSDAGDYRRPELGMIALPNAERPRVTVWVDESGACFVDGDARGERLADGAQIRVGDELWTLLVPELLRETTKAATGRLLRELSLSFVVSRDEENVELSISGGGLEVHLPHRSFNDLLLTLARVRIEDAARAELGPGEHGWVDSRSLQEMLRLDPEQLNLLVFRARRQFAELGVRDAPALVERRSGSRQLRLGVERLSVAAA